MLRAAGDRDAIAAVAKIRGAVGADQISRNGNSGRVAAGDVDARARVSANRVAADREVRDIGNGDAVAAIAQLRRRVGVHANVASGDVAIP